MERRVPSGLRRKLDRGNCGEKAVNGRLLHPDGPRNESSEQVSVSFLVGTCSLYKLAAGSWRVDKGPSLLLFMRFTKSATSAGCFWDLLEYRDR